MDGALAQRHAGLTLDQVAVHAAPGVAVLGGEDADVLGFAGRGRAADLLQLEAELLSRQRSSVAAVHLQHEELRERRRGRKHAGEDEPQPKPEVHRDIAKEALALHRT